MDTPTLVENQIADGEKLIGLLARKSFDVTAACWVRTTEEGRWFLYIVSKAVDAKGPAAAYRDVYSTLKSIGDAWISMSDIRLVGPQNPVAREVVDILRGDQGRMPIRARLGYLGGIAVEEVYIYPPPPVPPKGKGFGVETRRLKRDVERVPSLEELLRPLTDEEKTMLHRLISTGLSPEQAEYWIRKNRDEEIRSKPPIPAGTVVKARVAAWWGDNPEDDPNPLLQVETEDGAQGLTSKSNTQPVSE